MTEAYSIPPRKDRDLRWLAVDLDNTIAESVWPLAGIGPPMWNNVKKVQSAVDAGYKIIIHTSRHWMEYEMIERWLLMHNIPFNRILCGKVLAAAFIDDKNIDPNSESWIP